MRAALPSLLTLDSRSVRRRRRKRLKRRKGRRRRYVVCVLRDGCIASFLFTGYPSPPPLLILHGASPPTWRLGDTHALCRRTRQRPRDQRARRVLRRRTRTRSRMQSLPHPPQPQPLSHLDPLACLSRPQPSRRKLPPPLRWLRPRPPVPVPPPNRTVTQRRARRVRRARRARRTRPRRVPSGHMSTLEGLDRRVRVRVLARSKDDG